MCVGFLNKSIACFATSGSLITIFKKVSKQCRPGGLVMHVLQISRGMSKKAVLPCGMGGTGGFGGPSVGSGGLGGCCVDGVLGPQTSNKKSLLYFVQTLSKSKLV